MAWDTINLQFFVSAAEINSLPINDNNNGKLHVERIGTYKYFIQI